jgi:hypothetical protein
MFSFHSFLNSWMYCKEKNKSYSRICTSYENWNSISWDIHVIHV